MSDPLAPAPAEPDAGDVEADALENSLVEYDERGALFGDSGAGAYFLAKHLLASDWLAEVRRTAAKETAERVRAAFSGQEFEENAAAAAGEGEWSWFRWLALDAIAREEGRA